MPISGPVVFFQAADQREVIPGSALGFGLDESEALAASFLPASFASIASYAGAGPGPDAQFSYPAEALGIDDILPLEDDSIDDIAPIEEVEDIYPITYSPAVPEGPPPLCPTAQPQYGEEAQYPLSPQAPLFQASTPVYPEIPDYLSPFGASTPIPSAEQLTAMKAMVSDWEDEEIEIEIEAEGLEEIMFVPQAVKDQANAALGQIMNALAETGDLAANTVIPKNINEHQEAPAFLGLELNLDDFGPIQIDDEQPNALGPPPDVTKASVQPKAVEAKSAPAESEDLAKLVDEIDIDDLDSEL